MKVDKNISLKAYNTFGVDVKAKQFISVSSEDELFEILKRFYASELFIIGGGSNMLLTQDVEDTVLHVNLKGIEILENHKNHVLVAANAGENWHEFVTYCVNNNFGGIENLSLIPGNVGTAPVQNIGAYGVELKDTFEYCEAINRQTLTKKRFNLEDCEFGYRNSVFKNKLKDQFVISKVVFKLTKKKHNFKLDYGALKQEFAKKKPNLKSISDAVIAIRESKLPNPKTLGNSGSFFKNPIVQREKFEEIQKDFPDMPFYEINNDEIKIPAGWLIETTGLKGFREGDAGVHEKQALVLVNYGSASGQNILNLANLVQEKVQQKFGIMLENEVNIF
ncbi:UDP-N-acetylmuramate dehydrogenase [Psychroflexus aestuariivivens]|uniref:UDP-N-acetylmuramate dehydrogenase n=1 Tax=Psychroflexus aestuariivivens TaxID=1795040 RepID=UPI000FD73E44|nr:UDP-N-acetylmuramate dehydrogenase [Psychroflexus aestuariivivens]